MAPNERDREVAERLFRHFSNMDSWEEIENTIATYRHEIEAAQAALIENSREQYDAIFARNQELLTRITSLENALREVCELILPDPDPNMNTFASSGPEELKFRLKLNKALSTIRSVLNITPTRQSTDQR